MNSGEKIMETAAEIEALLISSIEALFSEVIFPNYGKVTSDGVKLGPTWWTQKLEAQGIVMAVHAIESRVSRWRKRTRSETESDLTSSPTDNQAASIRSAKSALRQHPELAGAFVEDPEIRRALNRAVDEHDRRQAGKRAQRTERKQNQDEVGQRLDNLAWVTLLGEAAERWARDAGEALRHIDRLPDSEKYWLTGATDRADSAVRATRRLIELGQPEMDAELRHLVENGG